MGISYLSINLLFLLFSQSCNVFCVPILIVLFRLTVLAVSLQIIADLTVVFCSLNSYTCPSRFPKSFKHTNIGAVLGFIDYYS